MRTESQTKAISRRRGQPRRSQKDQTKGMGNPYQAVIDEHVENIASLYARFEEKRPVMLLDIQSQEIYAYPFDEYKKELNTRDQRFLEEHRGRVSSGKVMVVFVRDHEARKLVSYQFERTRG